MKAARVFQGSRGFENLGGGLRAHSRAIDFELVGRPAYVFKADRGALLLNVSACSSRVRFCWVMWDSSGLRLRVFSWSFAPNPKP